jgi:hypothetical protein
MAQVITAKPPDYELFMAWYLDYVAKIVQRFGIDSQDAEDVAQDIMQAEWQAKNAAGEVVGILALYDENYTAEHQGQKMKVTFRTFLTSRVRLRCRGKRDTLNRRASRELLLCDTVTDTRGNRWIDLFGGAEWDDYSEIETREYVARIRAYLATVPPRSGADLCDLLALFDELYLEVLEYGEVSSARVQQRFGIGDATAAAWIGRLQQIMSGAGELPVPATHVIEGVTLKLTDLRSALDILRADKSIMVKQPLARANHPLSKAPEGWYHKFSKEEIKAYPELRIDPQTHKKPAGHVKLAVIHRLERMLGIGMAEAEPVAELEAWKRERVAELEPEPPETPRDRLEAALWHSACSATQVLAILALADEWRDYSPLVVPA